MTEAVIVSAARTAVGKAPNGTLRGTRPDELAAIAIRPRSTRAPGLDPADVDDVILGCAMPEAEQGMNVARIASLRAGIPVSASAVTVNRFCSSGLQAIAYAAERIMCGFAVGHRRRRHRVDEPRADGRQQDRAEPDADRSLSGRVSEHGAGRRKPRAGVGDLARGSRTPLRSAATSARWPRLTAGSSRTRSCRSRRGSSSRRWTSESSSELERSAERSAKASAERMVRSVTFAVDEGPRRDTSAEALAKLRPAFHAAGTVTAGNSSQTSDGAAAVIVMSAAAARERGLTPLGRFVTFATAGVEPERFGVGPGAGDPQGAEARRADARSDRPRSS